MNQLSKLNDVVFKRFAKYDYAIVNVKNIIPPEEDASTLFISAGMQLWKQQFAAKTRAKVATLQTCIRLNDLELVGDGSHLTSFEMLGNFSFGNSDYGESVQMWDAILIDLELKKDCIIHVHEGMTNHLLHWLKLGYPVKYDESCHWTDGGALGGFCSEVYWKGLELGNLVNTLGHSTDVGFGWERLLQVLEGKDRVDETELFRQGIHPICADHYRTIQRFFDHGIKPGNKGREYVCRRLIRRALKVESNDTVLIKTLPSTLWDDFMEERERREKSLKNAKRALKDHIDKSDEWWWDTFGVLPEELLVLKDNV